MNTQYKNSGSPGLSQANQKAHFPIAPVRPMLPQSVLASESRFMLLPTPHPQVSLTRTPENSWGSSEPRVEAAPWAGLVGLGRGCLSLCHSVPVEGVLVHPPQT